MRTVGPKPLSALAPCNWRLGPKVVIDQLATGRKPSGSLTDNRARLMHDGDADLAPPSRHGCGDLVARAVQQHIGFGIAEPQTPYMQVIEGRQHRRLEANLARSGIKLLPEARLRQPEDGGARPSLRRAHEDLKQRKSGKSIEAPGYAARAEQIEPGGFAGCKRHRLASARLARR